MYLVLTEKAEEFTKIKAILGTDAKRFPTRHALLESIDRDPKSRVIVVASSVKSELAHSLAAELRTSHPLISVILIRERIDVPTLTAALESGIKDVIDAQDGTGLVHAVERCEAVTERIESIVSQDETRRIRGKVITVFSAKGGCGKTTISSNLASALASDGVSRVCLIDLDLQFGDIATALRVPPTKTISDALEMTGAAEMADISTAIIRYQDRFDLLLAPTSPIEIDRISPEFISNLTSTLQGKYDYIVIDTAPSLSEVIVRTLRESDLAILITTLDMPAIKNVKLTIEALDALGYAPGRRILVLNRSDLRVGLEPRDVEELVGEAITTAIPSSSKVSLATNNGQLIVDAYPGNAVSKAILDLAREVRRLVKSDLEVRVA